MLPWVEANVMEVRVPDRTDDPAVEKVVKDFRSFANLHYDSKNLKTAAVSGQHNATPFFSETSTSQIISDLKKGGSSDSAGAGWDPLFCARVFLGFAQDFDRQGDELNKGLGVHERHSFALLKTLKGETEIDSAPIAPARGSGVDDPGEYMALARLQAWALLFQKDPVGSGLFVTGSKSVFNRLMAKVPKAEKIIESAGWPTDEIKDKAFNLWRDSFLKHLDQLGKTHWSAPGDTGIDLPLNSGGDTNVKLSLYLVPGQTPLDFFVRHLHGPQPPKKQPHQNSKYKNMLVGLVEWRP